MKSTLNPTKVQHTIQKNTATSYGLTLVTGTPFPVEISTRVQHIQTQLDALAPGCFTWYGLDHLHATLVAPLRGRYRDAPPLQRDELPADLEGFVQDLSNFFAGHEPFLLDLAGVHLTTSGFVLLGEKTMVGQLSSSLRRYPELDPPKHAPGLHVAIGYLNTERPFAIDEEMRQFELVLAEIRDTPVGRVLVKQVWLVHYANRTLDQIVGRVPFTLGKANAITVGRLLRELGIIDDGELQKTLAG